MAKESGQILNFSSMYDYVCVTVNINASEKWPDRRRKQQMAANMHLHVSRMFTIYAYIPLFAYKGNTLSCS